LARRCNKVRKTGTRNRKWGMNKNERWEAGRDKKLFEGERGRRGRGQENIHSLEDSA
jgi:hypothetical protein